MKKSTYISIFVAVALIIVAIIVLCLLLTADRPIKNVTLEENGVTHAKLDFNARGLHPSESREYTLVLHAGVNGKYKLSLLFNDIEGELAKYIVVEFVTDDGEEHTMPLTDTESFEFECEITKTYSIIVRYILPDQVGNEAQGAFADFELLLTAERV